jgi:two-component system NtrC family sensor kinase
VGSDVEITLPFDNKSAWLQRVAKDDRPYLEREMLALPEWQYVPASLHRQLETLEIKVFVPLVSRQELTGLLMLGAKASGRSYSLEELNLSQAVASHAATSMENARLYEEAHLQLQELKETQAQLIQSGKLASVGTLAAGVAHEVNNPVFAIMGMTELLLSNPESHLKSAQAEEYLSVIAEMSDRIAKVVQGMLVFSRNEQTPTLVSLNQVMEDTLRLMEHKLRVSGITVQKVYCLVLPPVRVVANKLQQALMNLILNASDAMGEDGTLTTGITDDQVWIACQDTGTGISQGDLDRIFDAFFTTKPVGKGTGLGLHITHRIVGECGGEIRVESELGRGTTFTIYVPIAEAEFEAPDFDDPFLLEDEWQDQTAGRHH